MDQSVSTCVYGTRLQSKKKASYGNLSSPIKLEFLDSPSVLFKGNVASGLQQNQPVKLPFQMHNFNTSSSDVFKKDCASTLPLGHAQPGMVTQDCQTMISTLSSPLSKVDGQSPPNSAVPNGVSIKIEQTLSTGPCSQVNIDIEPSNQPPTIIHLSLTDTMNGDGIMDEVQSYKSKGLNHFPNTESSCSLKLDRFNLSQNIKQEGEPTRHNTSMVLSNSSEDSQNIHQDKVTHDGKLSNNCSSGELSYKKQRSSVSCMLTNPSASLSISDGKKNSALEAHYVNGELSKNHDSLNSHRKLCETSKKQRKNLKQLPVLELSQLDNKSITVRKSPRKYCPRQTNKQCFSNWSKAESDTPVQFSKALSPEISKSSLPNSPSADKAKQLQKCNKTVKTLDVIRSTDQRLGTVCEAQGQTVTNCVFEDQQICYPDQKPVVLNAAQKTRRNVRKKRNQSKSVKRKNRSRAKTKRKYEETEEEKVTINISSQKPKRIKLPLGPYVHIVGTKEKPLSVHVINLASTGEEVVKQRPHVINRNPNGRLRHVGHLSTLSPAYDALTKDKTWICAFCHRGSHEDGLGDLFGPYYIHDDNPKEEDELLITSDADTWSGLVNKGNNKPMGSCAKGRKNSTFPTLSTQASNSQIQSTQISGSKSIDSQPNGPQDMVLNNSKEMSNVHLTEFWVHEHCASWAHGVYLAGVDQQVHGLAQAVKDATDMLCSECQLTGAVIGCRTKHCPKQFHYICAKRKGCEMNEETFCVLCPVHKKSTCREC
ncbi:uncharacterized protein LOC143226915 isoform X2 [Tachypleus tridentatus]|uniref:uncharacterized protein LOC143226915 isoform X2 n=1 Tax=Tachypleus tridentatus TaxID=6853 RepID=UPI003FD11701